MKNRILCIALALSLLAAIFVALPTRGAIDYTGSVRTMDSTGHDKEAFFEGDPVYVNVTLYYRGVLSVEGLFIQIQSPDGMYGYDSMGGTTDEPVTGYYNSTIAPNWMNVPYITGPMAVFNVVVYETNDWTIIASLPITVREQALTMSPEASPYYYPGEEVTITWTTTHTTDLFYMHIINATGVTFVNWSRQATSVDGWWSVVWKIDANLPDGTYRLRARSEASHSTISPTLTFSVQKYVLSVQPDRDPTWPYNPHYLPGETAKLTYLVYETATFMPYPGVTITYSSTWLNSSGNQTWQNGTLVGTSGVQDFVIPTDIALYSDIDITYWANESSRSMEQSLTLYLDQLFATLTVPAGPAPGDTFYMPGDLVQVTVTARVGPDLAAGAKVDIKVERNGTELTAYAAANLTTDLGGRVVHTFTLVAASPEDGYVVTATVTKAGYTVVKKASFVVEWDGELLVDWNKEFYFSGDSASVSFKTVWNNELIEVPTIGYQVTIATGLLATGNTTGQDISVSIPSDYYGFIRVDAQANYNGNLLTGNAQKQVYFADIVLVPASVSYRPGETITFSYEVITGLSSVSLAYKIVDADDVVAATGDLTGMSGSFDFVVPTVNPSDEYTATVTLSDGAGHFVSEDVSVDIMPNYELKVWVGKSSYVTGEYKPGQNVRIHYSINSYLYEDLPLYSLVVHNDWDNLDQVYLVSEASGTITYQIPADAPLGPFEIDVTLWDGVREIGLSGDMTQIVVNGQLTGWDKSVAGMSAIDFTLLIMIIIMILLLIIVPFLKGRMGAPKAAEPAKVEPPPPAAP